MTQKEITDKTLKEDNQLEKEIGRGALQEVVQIIHVISDILNSHDGDDVFEEEIKQEVCFSQKITVTFSRKKEMSKQCTVQRLLIRELVSKFRNLPRTRVTMKFKRVFNEKEYDDKYPRNATAEP